MGSLLFTSFRMLFPSIFFSPLARLLADNEILPFAKLWTSYIKHEPPVNNFPRNNEIKKNTLNILPTKNIHKALCFHDFLPTAFLFHMWTCEGTKGALMCFVLWRKLSTWDWDNCDFRPYDLDKLKNHFTNCFYFLTSDILTWSSCLRANTTLHCS